MLRTAPARGEYGRNHSSCPGIRVIAVELVPARAAVLAAEDPPGSVPARMAPGLVGSGPMQRSAGAVRPASTRVHAAPSSTLRNSPLP